MESNGIRRPLTRHREAHYAKLEAIRKEHNTPQQMTCPQCRGSLFYLMLQDSGSIEAYCSIHNHQHLIVNVPQLVEHLYKIQENTHVQEIERTNAGEHDPTNAASRTENSSNHSAGINGASAAANVQDPQRPISG